MFEGVEAKLMEKLLTNPRIAEVAAQHAAAQQQYADALTQIAANTTAIAQRLERIDNGLAAIRDNLDRSTRMTLAQDDAHRREVLDAIGAVRTFVTDLKPLELADVRTGNGSEHGAR